MTNTDSSILIQGDYEREVLRFLEEKTAGLMVAENCSDEDFEKEFLWKSEEPDTFLIKKIRVNELRVKYNNFSSLADWAEELSHKLHTRVAVAVTNDAAAYYYLAVYVNGNKIREIEVCYGGEMEPTDFGDLLPFETERPIAEGIIFDATTIKNFSRALGFEFTFEHSYGWKKLQKVQRGVRIHEYLTKLGKPWWRFW